MDLSRFPRRRYTLSPTPIEPLPRFSAALAASCRGGRGPEVWIKRDDLLGLFPGRQQDPQARIPGRRCVGARRRHADHLRRAAIQPLPHHIRRGSEGRAEVPLRDRRAGARQLRHDASGNHFMFRLMGVEAITVVPGGHRHGRRDGACAAALAGAGPQGLHHPRRRLERAGRARLRGLRAGNPAAVFRQRRALRPHRRRLGQLGHARRAAGRVSRQPIAIPIVGIGVSRDPAQQEPLVHARGAGDVASCSGSVGRCRAKPCAASAATGSRSTRCPTRAWSRRCKCSPALEGRAARPGVHRQGDGRA